MLKLACLRPEEGQSIWLKRRQGFQPCCEAGIRELPFLMEKILVQWSNGRSQGMTSLVRKTAVKTGTIIVGKKVVVCWGKSKKTYNAQVISLSNAQAPASPAATRNVPEDQFCLM